MTNLPGKQHTNHTEPLKQQTRLDRDKRENIMVAGQPGIISLNRFKLYSKEVFLEPGFEIFKR